MSDDDKEYRLRLVQVWSDQKLRIATLALIGNGALLGVATAFLKDIGPAAFDALPLFLGLIGASLGGFAVMAVVDHTDRFFEIQLDGGTRDETKAKRSSEKLTEKRLSKFPRSSTVALTNRISLHA
jgi:hypothetical protein